MGLANDQTQKYSITSNGGDGKSYENQKQLKVPQMGIGVTNLKKIRKRGLGITHLEKIRLQKRIINVDDDDDDDVHNNVSSMPNLCNPAATVPLPGMMSSNDEINRNGNEIFHYYPHMTLPPPSGPPPSLLMHQFQSRPISNRKQFQVARENSVASRSNFHTLAMSSSTSAANHPSLEIPHLQYLPCEQEDSEPSRQKRGKFPYYDFLPLNKKVTNPSTVNKRSKNKSGSKEETQQNIDLTLKL